MGRRALTRGGTAAVLALLALYVLLGGDLDLGGGEETTTSTTTPTVAAPPTGAESETTDTTETETETDAGQEAGSEVPRASRSDLSEQEAVAIAATLALIGSGRPLPHDQDGTTFQNREGLLPDRPEGHYREYTVETPGSDDRGARRLVIAEAGETYYTRDHYDSFVEIDPAEFR